MKLTGKISKTQSDEMCVDRLTHDYFVIETTPISYTGSALNGLGGMPLQRTHKLCCRKCGTTKQI